MTAARKLTMPATWCGAEEPNETGGSPHHCWNPGDHPEFAVHSCPCGISWPYTADELSQ